MSLDWLGQIAVVSGDSEANSTAIRERITCGTFPRIEGVLIEVCDGTCTQIPERNSNPGLGRIVLRTYRNELKENGWTLATLQFELRLDTVMK